MTELPLDHYRHRLEVITRRSDTTMTSKGHILNGVLASYFDDAREGLHRAILNTDPFGELLMASLVLGELHFRFRNEVTFPGPLTIGVGVRCIGGSSIEESAGFFRDDKCLTTAWCTMIKLVEGRSAPFNEEERERASAYSIPARSVYS
jgi:acyl-CoA thioesterase FadM